MLAYDLSVTLYLQVAFSSVVTVKVTLPSVSVPDGPLAVIVGAVTSVEFNTVNALDLSIVFAATSAQIT